MPVAPGQNGAKLRGRILGQATTYLRPEDGARAWSLTKTSAFEAQRDIRFTTRANQAHDLRLAGTLFDVWDASTFFFAELCGRASAGRGVPAQQWAQSSLHSSQRTDRAWSYTGFEFTSPTC